MRDILRMGEVFLSRVCGWSLLSVFKSANPASGFGKVRTEMERATHFRRGTSRNGGSRTHTRHRRDDLVPSIVHLHN